MLRAANVFRPSSHSILQKLSTKEPRYFHNLPLAPFEDYLQGFAASG